MLKLLTPQAVKDIRAQEVARDLLRAKETEEIVKKANLRLSKSQEDFAMMLAKNRETWAQEEKEHADRVIEMTKEIEALEYKKQQALIPIELYRKKADTVMEEAKIILQRSKEKEVQLDELRESFEERLDDVSQREIDVETEHKKLESLKIGIQKQSDQVKLYAQNLSEEMKKFANEKAEKEALLDQRNKEVQMAEIHFIAKTEKYQRDVEALRNYEIKLKDERETLARAFESIKHVNNKTKSRNTI